MVIAGSLLVALGCRITGLSVAAATAAPYFLMIILLILIAFTRRGMRNERQLRLADLIESLGLFCWVSALGGLGSYVVAASSHGFHDAMLARIDGAIGFDWTGMYDIIVAHPWLTLISAPAYRSIFITPLLVIAGLTLAGEIARVRTFIAIFGAALLLSLALFYFFPARAALMFYVGAHPAYPTVTSGATGTIIGSLRDGSVTVIDLAQLAGLLSFPSFHATSAILFVWAGWPLRKVRVPLIIVNGAMLAATPLEGAHYLIDVIGGVMIAFGFIFALHARAAVTAVGRSQFFRREESAV